MAIDMIGASASPPSVSNNSAAALGQDDFLRILMTQLTYQDPLKPLDNQEFIAQMAQFTTLEQTRQIGEKMDQVLSSQAVMQSFALIGKQVVYGSQNAAGIVTGVSFNLGQPALTVTG